MDVKKFLVSLLATILVAVQTGLADHGLDLLDWLTITAAGLGAFGVWLAPNITVAPYVKAGIQFAFSLVTIASTFLADGVFTATDLVTTVIMAFATIGVVAVKGPMHNVTGTARPVVT
jgi:hypothetical protein